jgi:hypothetical protein
LDGNNHNNRNSLSLVDFIIPLENEDHDNTYYKNHQHPEKTCAAVVSQPIITIKEDSQGTMDMTQSEANDDDDDYEQDEVWMWNKNRSEVGVEKLENSESMLPQQHWTDIRHQDHNSGTNVLPRPPSMRKVVHSVMDHNLDSTSSMEQVVIEKAITVQSTETHNCMNPQRSFQLRPVLGSSMKDASTTTSVAAVAIDKKQVRFGKLEIYEHLIAMGYGAVPSSSGPSLTLQPEPQAYFEVSIEDYEAYRPAPPRRGLRLLRSKNQRIEV